ncbi:MAG TPA: acyl-ACP--UDP-N-acetylglucosamine O-acyltransferase [Vicinamibacteria bacterium]
MIHPTAIVAPGACLGDGVRVGPYAVIEDGVVLGAGTEVRAHVVVKRFTTLGVENVVHEGAVLGGEPQDLAFSGAESALVVGDRNVIREGVTIHRATTPGGATVIGSDCFFMAYSHVAHDDRLADRVVLANNVALAGHVSLGERAFLSGGVVVHQFSAVGRLAMIGGNAKVTQDCLPFVITDGVPARARGLNVVGLRRAGFNAASLRVLKQAYRLLLRSALPLEEALGRMSALGDPLVEEMVAFVRASRRGFHRAQGADDERDE